MRYASTHYVDRRFADLDKSLAIQRHQNEVAGLNALAALNSRLDGMNAFRQALSDQTATFVRRIEAEGVWARTGERINALSAEHQRFINRDEHDVLIDRINSLDTRLTRSEGTDTGAASRQANFRQSVIVTVALLSVILSVIIPLIVHYIP